MNPYTDESSPSNINKEYAILFDDQNQNKQITAMTSQSEQITLT